MKKNAIVLILIMMLFFAQSVCFGLPWKKKPKPVLFLSPYDPQIELEKTGSIKSFDVFKPNQRIYFLVYTPDGFKSDYIRYQIVKQDDNAHVGGYSRIRNITVRLKDKNTYIDYFMLTGTGKYYLQIFDIQNLHQWLAIASFKVVNE